MVQNNVAGSNCVYTVQKALKAAGLDNGANPKTNYGISLVNPVIGELYRRTPRDIYRRIKINNSGTVITPKK